MYKEYRPYRTFLILTDMLLTLMLFALAVELRPILPGRIVESAAVYRIPAVYLTVPCLWCLLFGMTGVYALANIPVFSKQLGRFTVSYLLAILVFGGFLYFTYREMSRMVVLYFSVGNFFVLLVTRYGLTRYLGRALKGVRRSNVLMVGSDQNAINLATTILEDHGSIYEVVGFADNDWSFQGPLPAPFVGQVDEVPRLVQEYDVHLVVIALPESRSQLTDKLIRDLDLLPVRVYLSHDLGMLALLRSEVENFGNSLVIGIREPIIQGPERMVKRIFDLTVATLMLMATWPLFLMIWVAVRLDSPGPAIHRAERVGENGKLFQMLKFRSMIVGAEDLQDQVATEHEEGPLIYKSEEDSRVTRVGKFLRRTSLDELPQLINVFKGEMSLVGPRPEQPFIAREYDHWQRERLAVPPGMTGWWQISGRSYLPMHLNVHLDLYYVKNYSLFLDIKILLRTIVVVLQGKGAY